MSAVFQRIFGKSKAAVGMAHFPPLPGTPLYDEKAGIKGIIQSLEQDVEAMVAGGIDGVMFGNEGDRPYFTKVGPETVAVMAAVIAQLKPILKVPFGVDVLWDPAAAVALAVAVEAKFVREVFTNVYDSDMGLWNPNAGEALRLRRNLHGTDIALFFNINAEFAAPLGRRDIVQTAKSVVFSSIPDGICVSGPMTGSAADVTHIQAIRDVLPDTTIVANTGVNKDNVKDILKVADGCFIGTSLKKDGNTWNNVDAQRVKDFMAAVNASR